VDFVSPEHQQPYQQRQHRAVPPKEKNSPEVHKHHNEPKEHTKTADYSREAEIIVKEERQAKNNIPQYKGLERYRILEKMGESVLTSFLIGVVLIPRHHSGAFSNVFKAQDLSTGQKVASTGPPYHHLRLLTLVSSTVKVVRKYELSSQQVSVS